MKPVALDPAKLLGYRTNVAVPGALGGKPVAAPGQKPLQMVGQKPLKMVGLKPPVT